MLYGIRNVCIQNSCKAFYQIRKIVVCACTGNAGNVTPRRLQRKPLVSDPGMHHDTVSRTCRDACRDRGRGKTFPAFPAHAHPPFYVSGKSPNTRHSTESQLGREFSPLGCLRLVLAYNFYFVYGGDMSMSPYDGSRADANYGLIASCDDARFPSHEYSPRTQRHTFTTPSGVQCATQICNFSND